MGIITVMNKREHPGTVLCTKICLGDTHVLTGCMDGIIRLYNIKEGELAKMYKDEEGMKESYESVTGMAILKDDKGSRTFAACHSDGQIKYWNLQSGALIRTVLEDRTTLSLVQNPHDRKFLSLGSDGIIYYYDTETGQKIRSFMNSASYKVEGHSSKVFAASFHPKQTNEFVSGGWDNTILYWDMRKPQSCKAILGPHICGDGLDINPTGHLILSCSYSSVNPFQLYEYASGKNYLSLEYNQNKLYCGKWLAPMYLATGSSDPSILNIVDMYSINVISYYRSNDTGVYSIDNINLNSRKKNFKEEDLSSVVVFTSGSFLITLKLEFTHK